MKIRTLIAAAMSVALLTVFVAAPVSAGGPATVKVAQRGVEWAVSAIVTNCPQFEVNGLTHAAPARAAVDAALKLKTSRTTKQGMSPCGDVQTVTGQDYYAFVTKTAVYAFGQAGSGYWFTGLGVNGPVTGIFGWYASWNGMDWDMIGIDRVFPASSFVFSDDIAYGGAITQIPGLGTLWLGPCGSLGPWGRDSYVETGGVDPGDGWTHNISARYRACYFDLGADYSPPVGYGVSFLPIGADPFFGWLDATFATAELSRTVVATVDVYPW
jgi:hypothetical protein